MSRHPQRVRKPTPILNMQEPSGEKPSTKPAVPKKSRETSPTAPSQSQTPISGRNKTRKVEAEVEPTSQLTAALQIYSREMSALMKPLHNLVSTILMRVEHLESARQSPEGASLPPKSHSDPVPITSSHTLVTPSGTTPSTPSKIEANSTPKKLNDILAPTNPRPPPLRLHLADVTPSTDYLRLELEEVRVVSRADPIIKSLSKGPRQVVAMFVVARPRIDANSIAIEEPNCVQLSLWSPVGAVVPQTPQVGDIVRIRGFTACKPTYPFDKWHTVELQSDWTEIKFDHLPDDNSLPWEKALNPKRTIHMKQTTPQAPVATKKFCPDCGGALTGNNRRTHCENGLPH